MIRNNNDPIIITILPHIFALYYVKTDVIYTTIIISSVCSSYIWHRHCEPHNCLFVIDYTFASILSTYEVVNIYINKKELLTLCIILNVSVLMFNKIVYVLTLKKYIQYKPWHSFYHILSSLKTIFLASR